MIKLGLPVWIFLFKISNRKTKIMCEICLKLTIKTPERCYNVLILDFELVLQIAFMFPFSTFIK